jgi:uncharacterized membrane protein YgdD (TMEM256/DUF423 family)
MAMGKSWIVLGSLSAFLSVAAGAFGAHGLKERLAADLLAIFETGARYQMVHALGLIALGLLASRSPQAAQPFAASVAGWAFVAGTVLFSGSLYGLSLTGIRALGAITPLGGLAFLAGWIGLAVAAVRSGP